MKTIRQTVNTIIAGLAVTSALAVPVHAQTNQMPPMPGKSGAMAMGGGMKAMQADMKAMQADTKAMDDELGALVVRMNQTSGSDKTDAMAAVITKMAQQRQMMDQKMAAMQASMMQGMTPPMKMAPPMKMPK